MNKNKTSPAARAAILLSVIAVPLLFIGASVSTGYLAKAAPALLIVALLLGVTIYVAITTRLLYRFCEAQMPWFGWLPCYGELAILDSKYIRIGTPLYIAAAVFLALSRIPYSVLSVLPEGLAIYFPLFMMGAALIVLVAVQIVKGLGFMHCIKFIESEWKERMHTDLGLIKSLSLLGFIPFVRVMAVYAMNKPLSTMVTFRNITISENESVTLREE